MNRKTLQKNRQMQIDLIEIAVVCLLVYLIFSYVILLGNIPSSSMEPTLMAGDIAIANGMAYVNHEPQRGDIVIFNFYEEDKPITLIKRVIGVPGDHIEFIDGYVYINNQLLYEEYLDNHVETNCAKIFDVPEECYFMLGDNRENSYDARFWINPYVNKKEIIGKLLIDIPLADIKHTVKEKFSAFFM